MSSDFVRYASEIETFDPKLSEYMTRVIEFWETKVRESPTREGTGRAVRGAHAKTIGVARAEVEIVSDTQEPYAQGIYATFIANTAKHYLFIQEIGDHVTDYHRTRRVRPDRGGRVA